MSVAPPPQPDFATLTVLDIEDFDAWHKVRSVLQQSISTGLAALPACLYYPHILVNASPCPSAPSRQVFTEHQSARKENGILGHHINRAYGNPHRVSVYFALSDVEKVCCARRREISWRKCDEEAETMP